MKFMHVLTAILLMNLATWFAVWPRPIAQAAPVDCSTLAMCANGRPRNATTCVCQAMPACANRCQLGALESVANSCWNHTDYATQTAPDGLSCAYTFPPKHPCARTGCTP